MTIFLVIPAEARTQEQNVPAHVSLDPRFRGGDERNAADFKL
jgi:hypothetical protein